MPIQLWLPLKDAAGAASVLDASGNSRNGVPTNGVSLGVAGRRGWAASFDGVDDYIRVTGWSFGPQFSVTAWVNPTNITTDLAIVANTNAGTTGGFQFRCWSGGKMACAIFNSTVAGSDCFSNTSNVVGSWQHVAVTYDGTTVRFYRNGVADGTGTPTAGTANSLDLLVGAGNPSSPNSFFNGRLDDIRLYSNVLSATEINQIYVGRSAFVSKYAIL